jgi:hypothetical protein
MTGSDLIVAAPWIAFAVTLAIVCFLLLRLDRASRSTRRRRIKDASEKDGHHDQQEARCPEKELNRKRWEKVSGSGGDRAGR